MDINPEDVKTFSELSRPIIDPIISTVIRPQLDRLNKWFTQKDKRRKVDDNFWETKFSKYLEVLYNDALYVTTLVFPNSRTQIKDLYVPLTLINANTFHQYRIEDFDISLFNHFNKIIISDYAGMGKSTILKWITVSLIEQNKSVPLLIELRKIDGNNSLIDEIFNQLNPLDNSFDKDIIYHLLELGFFTILLDGFDEIPYDIQDKITVNLSDFIKKAGNNNFIMTSRPESALSTFSDFQLFNIKPLSNIEANEIIRKLDYLSKVKFGDKLIEEIKERNTQVKEFLTNPFLVSLLYKSYTYNKDIPSKKITFYEEVYSCLFKHHDLSKEGFKRPKRSRLDIFDFELILREVAFSTSKVGRVIYTKDELLRYIIDSKKKNSRIDFKEQNFYDDLTTTVPLFNIEGQKIKWAHKSIQDFFSAKYISTHSRKEEIIRILFESDKFHYLNILDLLFELEYNVFRKIIIKNILESFISFYESTFAIKPDVPQELIDERIALMFGTQFCLIKIESEEKLNFSDAVNIFNSRLEADESVQTGITLHHSNIPYYSMNKISLVKEIIKMLRIKNEDLFLDTNTHRSQYEEYYLDCYVIEGANIIQEKDVLQDFELNEPYIINDDIEGPYNKPHIFLNITQILEQRLITQRETTYRSYNLDYKKCKAQLDLIEGEISIEESQDLLADI